MTPNRARLIKATPFLRMRPPNSSFVCEFSKGLVPNNSTVLDAFSFLSCICHPDGRKGILSPYGSINGLWRGQSLGLASREWRPVASCISKLTKPLEHGALRVQVPWCHLVRSARFNTAYLLPSVLLKFTRWRAVYGNIISHKASSNWIRNLFLTLVRTLLENFISVITKHRQLLARASSSLKAS